MSMAKIWKEGFRRARATRDTQALQVEADRDLIRDLVMQRDTYRNGFTAACKCLSMLPEDTKVILVSCAPAHLKEEQMSAWRLLDRQLGVEPKGGDS